MSGSLVLLRITGKLPSIALFQAPDLLCVDEVVVCFPIVPTMNPEYFV
jgi:hypothetical protein